VARCNLQGMALYFSAMADARIRPIRIPLHAPWEWYHGLHLLQWCISCRGSDRTCDHGAGTARTVNR
jgi:hypothetical protein